MWKISEPIMLVTLIICLAKNSNVHPTHAFEIEYEKHLQKEIHSVVAGENVQHWFQNSHFFLVEILIIPINCEKINK